MGKAVLIILLSSGIMFSIVSLNTNKILEQATSKAIDYHSQIRARNIANSMVSIALSKLSDDNDYRVSSLVSKNLLGGNVASSGRTSWCTRKRPWGSPTRWPACRSPCSGSASRRAACWPGSCRPARSSSA